MRSGTSGGWSVIGGKLPIVRASALTGEGIAELRGEILRHIGGKTGAEPKPGSSPTFAIRDW